MGGRLRGRTPDCLHTATFFAEPSAAADVRRALDQGARVFKCHLQVGDFDPNDPLLDEAWGLLADARVPVVTHCGSGPVPGRFTGPEPVARLLARYPGLRLVVAHLGMPEYMEFLDLAERNDHVMLDTTMSFTLWIEEGGAPFPARRAAPAARPRRPRAVRHRLPQHPALLRRRPRGPGDDRPRHAVAARGLSRERRPAFRPLTGGAGTGHAAGLPALAPQPPPAARVCHRR